MSQWKRRGGSFSTGVTRRQTPVIPEYDDKSEGQTHLERQASRLLI
uniref:Uncharacterized protein n=1 Tax=Heterorhabditis bacteriophora TaxID=37862 RepID=A0A1I7XQ05_HETBA